MIKQFIETEEELNKSMEKPKESHRVIVCGLASPESQEGKDAMMRRTGMAKSVSRKGK